LRHNQQVPSQSVEAHNAKSASLSDMATVVAMIFQQITTELSWAQSEEGRIMVIIKTVLKIIKISDRFHRE
jgi:hypothetical protein